MREARVRKPMRVLGAALSAVLVLILAACGKSGGAGGAGATGGGGGQGGGRCSDPNPDYAALTFAAVICVLGETTVPQSDGSQELKLQLEVTNKDPNAFTMGLWKLEVADAAGNHTDVDFDGVLSGSRTGAEDCIKQTNDPFGTGWPLQPGESFTLPGTACFNLQAGDDPQQLIFDSDITVALG